VTRVNLLRPVPDRRHAGLTVDRWRGVAACCVLVALTSSGVGWWWWTQQREATRLEIELLRARDELARLRTAAARAEALTHASRGLQQRIGDLEALGAAQRAPLGVLDAIGAALPRQCWLTSIAYEPSGPVRVEGRARALASLFGFAQRREAARAFDGGVQVVESHLDTSGGDGPVVAFAVEAHSGVRPHARHAVPLGASGPSRED
jgi:hypothetical protein